MIKVEFTGPVDKAAQDHLTASADSLHQFLMDRGFTIDYLPSIHFYSDDALYFSDVKVADGAVITPDEMGYLSQTDDPIQLVTGCEILTSGALLSLTHKLCDPRQRRLLQSDTNGYFVGLMARAVVHRMIDDKFYPFNLWAEERADLMIELETMPIVNMALMPAIIRETNKYFSDRHGISDYDYVSQGEHLLKYFDRENYLPQLSNVYIAWEGKNT